MTGRVWIKRAAVVLCAASLSWGGYWVALAYLARQSADLAAQAIAQEGIPAEFSRAQIAGFPNKIALTLADLAVGEGGAILWSTQAAKIEADATRPNRLFLDLSQPHRLAGDFGALTLDTAQAGLMVLFAPSWNLPVADVQFAAQDMRLTGRDMPDLALAAIAARITDRGSMEPVYDATIDVDQLDMTGVMATWPQAYQVIQRISFAGDLVLDRPWDRRILLDGYPNLRGIDLRELRLEVGTSALLASGQLVVEANGLLSGTLSVSVDQWRPLLALARDQGFVEPGLEAFLQAALDGLAMADGNPDTIAVPFVLREGLVSFGALTLGMVPAAR